MGKSGGKKKKANANQNQAAPANNPAPVANGGADLAAVHAALNSSVFLKRAHELKEEGNKKFQEKDYATAIEKYDNALRLIPRLHPDRAIFYSNKAACLMQMKPIEYDTVISHCSLALEVQPGYVRALLRRARAYEAVGKFESALQDVQVLLGSEPNHRDALEIARRIRAALGTRPEGQQDLQSRPSPAALGASAVRGAPISGLGPCLPARPVPKKTGGSPSGSGAVSNNKQESNPKINPALPAENGPEVKTQMPRLVLKPSNGSTKPNHSLTKDSQKEKMSLPVSVPIPIRYRQLKLVYDHDIRLAQMPVNCSFKVLRETVSARFPSSKSVLIKYKDADGDLVTITCTSELRSAESYVDSLASKELDLDRVEFIEMLRLHIVEVSPEQEPALPEEEEIVEEEKLVEDSGSHSSLGDSLVEAPEIEVEKAADIKEKSGPSNDQECKEVEMDDWLFEFAQLFRTHVGIDPDAHIDLHELGMELCSEALEETVTSEEAQNLFDKAALKFQEVAALAFFNWGNVHMCAARKRIPIDDSAAKDLVSSQLQSAYDWVKEKYTLAKEKYEEALQIKPDFYEGLLALGQQQFEMAKLHWSFVLAKKDDLSKWDPSETISLFDSAEEKMKSATQMWEKIEEQRAKELKDPNFNKKEELLRRRKKQGNNVEVEQSEITPSVDEAAEQAAMMKSQIHLFWGNMLFERSQVECKLGLDGWNKNLDTAVERFKLAGASEADISTVLKNHCSIADANPKADNLVTDVIDKEVSKVSSE